MPLLRKKKGLFEVYLVSLRQSSPSGECALVWKEEAPNMPKVSLLIFFFKRLNLLGFKNMPECRKKKKKDSVFSSKSQPPAQNCREYHPEDTPGSSIWRLA